MKEQIERIRAEKARIHAEIVELNESVRSGDEVRQFSAEEKEKWERLSGTFDSLKEEQDRLEQIRSMGEHMDAPATRAVAQRQTAEQPIEAPENRDDPTNSKAYRVAFERWIREKALGPLSDEHRQVLRKGFQRDEHRALGDNPQTITTTGGGYAVADEMMAPLQENLLAFGGLRNAPITVVQTSGGNPWPIPTDDDTSNSGAILDINTATDDQDVTFGQVVLGAFKFTSKIILIPYEFLEDVNFPVLEWVGRKLGTRLARGQAPYFITGDGSAEPGGLDLADNFHTAAADDAISRTDVINLMHAVDPAYRSNSTFAIGDDALKTLKMLSVSSSDDRPLWQPSMREGEPDRIEGRPYTIVQEVADIGGGAHSMYFGDMSKFWLREAGPIRMARMDERFGEYDQVAFVGFQRIDSDIIDSGTAPIAYLRHPAS